MKDRIYICHTYYHAYVTFLKELKIRAEADPARKAGTATLVLSKMSNNFENLKARVESTGLFEEVLEFDEKREDYFPELAKYRLDTGNFLGNLKNRIRFHAGICQTGGTLRTGEPEGIQGYLCLLRFRPHRVLSESESYPLSCSGGRSELSEEFRCRPV